MPFFIIVPASYLQANLLTVFLSQIIFVIPKNDLNSIKNYLNLTLKYLLMIFTPIFMFSFLLRKEIILFVLGQDFIPAIPVFSWMLLATYILLLANPYDYALYATKKHASLVKVNLISLILSWLLSVYLMSYLHLGAVGAAVVVTAYGLPRKILAFLFILTLFTLSCQPES